jgi:hypothetical protein
MDLCEICGQKLISLYDERKPTEMIDPLDKRLLLVHDECGLRIGLVPTEPKHASQSKHQ